MIDYNPGYSSISLFEVKSSSKSSLSGLNKHWFFSLYSQAYIFKPTISDGYAQKWLVPIASEIILNILHNN